VNAGIVSVVVETELGGVSDKIDRLVAPRLTQLRANYATLADKRGEIREAFAVFTTIKDLENRRSALEAGGGDLQGSSVTEGDLQAIVAENFARSVEGILSQWHFPDAERVFFDSKLRDLVIAGKPRGARGKGLRAITHAAFTIGLMQFCKTNNTPHPGFVVLGRLAERLSWNRFRLYWMVFGILNLMWMWRFLNWDIRFI